MEKHARLAGYSVALLLLAGLLWIVSSLREGLLFPHNRVQVAFPAIGTLMEDDPIRLQGVQVGRVSSIEARDGRTLAVLEFFHRTPIPADSRFINYNYSMFGARMVILAQGTSRVPMDPRQVQEGYFSSGVAESIHKVEDLLVTMLEFRRLGTRLEKGTDSTLSIQQLLTRQVYPALDRFGALTRDLGGLENDAASQLDRLAAASAGINAFGKDLSSESDTLMLRANRSLIQLTTLTSQATVILKGLEDIIIACEDTTKGANRFLVQRDMYDHALSLTHALQDLLKAARKDGLTDVIHFWRNVHLKGRKADRTEGPAKP